MLDILLERFNYIPIIVLMMTGLYVVFATGNLVKRLVGLSLFQTSVFLLYITLAKVFGGQPPIIADAHGEDYGAAAAGHGAAAADAMLYSNPLPHVLIRDRRRRRHPGRRARPGGADPRSLWLHRG